MEETGVDGRRTALIEQIRDYLVDTGDASVLKVARQATVKMMCSNARLSVIGIHLGMSERSIYRLQAQPTDFEPTSTQVILKFCRHDRTTREVMARLRKDMGLTAIVERDVEEWLNRLVQADLLTVVSRGGKTVWRAEKVEVKAVVEGESAEGAAEDSHIHR